MILTVIRIKFQFEYKRFDDRCEGYRYQMKIPAYDDDTFALFISFMFFNSSSLR